MSKTLQANDQPGPTKPPASGRFSSRVVRSCVRAAALVCSAAVIGLAWQWIAVSAAEPAAEGSEQRPMTVAAARDRAETLQQVYLASLHMMHERYFHDERAVVPARALEDVFAEIERQSKVKARWISVNTKPMSVGHEPKSAFEKLAADKIADGEQSVELVEDGMYQRAVAVPLTADCVSCHTGFFRGPPKSPRYAALVLGMAVAEK